MESSITERLGNLGIRASRQEPLQGGSTGRVSRVVLEDGGTRIVKLAHPGQRPEQFLSEAESLRALRIPGSVRVPAVLDVSPELLLLEDLGAGTPEADFWELLADGLSVLHGIRGPAFGFFHTTWLGSTELDNSWKDDGWAFFGAQRIRPLLARARDLGLLDPGAVRRGEQLCGKLRDRIPESPAVLVHGDLWSGNILADAEGLPCLIDPACHYGWAEADLAMTQLFGRTPPRFLRHYQEITGLERRWIERIPLYNLVHLLNHLVLFGAVWRDPVLEILARE